MNKEQFKQAVETVRKNSPKRKFKQRFDLVINLKDINLKDSSQHIDTFIQLHNSKGRKTKVCALVGSELISQAKEVCDFAVGNDDFINYEKDKKQTKKLAKEYDFFIAQADIMPAVAKSFGRVLGPKGKMPNPKAGCVVPSNANLKILYDKLQTTVRVVAKTSPSIQVLVGSEEMNDEEVLDNIMTVYDQVIHLLPAEKNNIKNMYLKFTMGNSFKVGEKEEAENNTEEKSENIPKEVDASSKKADEKKSGEDEQ